MVTLKEIQQKLEEDKARNPEKYRKWRPYAVARAANEARHQYTMARLAGETRRLIEGQQ